MLVGKIYSHSLNNKKIYSPKINKKQPAQLHSGNYNSSTKYLSGVQNYNISFCSSKINGFGTNDIQKEKEFYSNVKEFGPEMALRALYVEQSAYLETGSASLGNIRRKAAEDDFYHKLDGCVRSIVKLDETIQKGYLEGKNIGLSDYEAYKYSFLSNKKKSAFIEGRRMGLDNRDNLQTYVNFNEDETGAFIAGKANGLESKASLYYAQLDDTQKTSFWTAKDMGLNNYELLVYACLNTKQKNAFEEGKAKGLNNQTALYYAKLSKAEKGNFWKGKQEGLEDYTALEYSYLNDKQKELFQEGTRVGLSNFEAIAYSYLNDVQRNDFWYGKGIGLNTIDALQCAKS